MWLYICYSIHVVKDSDNLVRNLDREEMKMILSVWLLMMSPTPELLQGVSVVPVVAPVCLSTYDCMEGK